MFLLPISATGADRARFASRADAWTSTNTNLQWSFTPAGAACDGTTHLGTTTTQVTLLSTYKYNLSCLPSQVDVVQVTVSIDSLPRETPGTCSWTLSLSRLASLATPSQTFPLGLPPAVPPSLCTPSHDVEPLYFASRACGWPRRDRRHRSAAAGQPPSGCQIGGLRGRNPICGFE